MSPLCENVEPFADGTLSPLDAEAFRDHTTTCASCQGDLAELAQLRALEDRYRRRFAASPPALPRVPRWRWVASGAAVALAAGLVVALSLNALDRVPDSAFFPGQRGRLTDARSAHPQARAYRPMQEGTLGGPGSGTAARSLSGVVLGKLEKKGDKLGVAALYLAQGTPADAQLALRALEGAPESADVLSEEAYAYLVSGDADQGEPEMALRLATRAVERQPAHGPALWNRALAYQALGLDLLAAKDFEAVAALGEPGWKDEAASRAAGLRKRVADGYKNWLAMVEVGQHLVETGSLPDPHLLRQAPVLRHFFYDAVRVQTSREAVLGLLPIAEDAGDAALVRYVQETSRRNFTVRRPLAEAYRRLAAKDQTLDAAQLLERLRGSQEADLLVGAIAKLTKTQLDVKELQRLAEATSQDAWLHTQALALEADALQRAGEDHASRDAYEKALGACMAARLEYRCVEVELALTYAFDRAADLEQGLAHARSGWKAAITANEWGRQMQFILELAQMTRQRQDAILSRAYYEEALARENASLEHQRYAHEGLAILDVHQLRLAQARRHLDAAIATGLPLGLTGALALSDVARRFPSPKDASAMEAFRTHPSGQPYGEGERALAEEALGRWRIETGEADGAERLRGAIERAKAGGLALRDPFAGKALAYAYAALILDAGKRGDAEGALRLFEEEWLGGAAEGALPARCLLAVTVDGERTLAVARGADGGAPVLRYDDRRMEPLPRELSGLLPPELPRSFSGCATVAVLARAPVYGRPGLLPGDLAWSYLGVRAVQEVGLPAGPRRHLVVQEVAVSPQRRGLRSPPRWEVPELAGERRDQLTDRAATPSAVLRWMEDITDVTFVTHALVNLDSDEAFLLLAPEPGSGTDALTASELQRHGAFLKGHPLVVLASCKGAQPGPVLHEARNLPAAFLRAGARAVLAASDDVPDQAGPAFFNGVRERILRGDAPAEALRAERRQWLARDPEAKWLNGVLLFQ